LDGAECNVRVPVRLTQAIDNVMDNLHERGDDVSGAAATEWWQRGPVDGVSAVLQPVAHILLQIGESVDEMTVTLTESQWNAKPAGIASAAFHVRHITGVIDRLFAYARATPLTDQQLAALRAEGDGLAIADVPTVLRALRTRIDAAVDELRTIDQSALGEWRGVGRANLPSTVIGCLVHGAEHGMRHVGQLSVTVRIVRAGVGTGIEAAPDPDVTRSFPDRSRGTHEP